jgi:hypothetical protein
MNFCQKSVEKSIFLLLLKNCWAEFSEICHKLTYGHPHDACMFSFGLNNFWIFGELFCFSHVNEWGNLTWR